MKPFLPSANSPVMDWLFFAAVLLPICLAIGGFVIWTKVRRNNTTKRKRKHRHHRRTNPTLAETGGLPPRRDPNRPPAGP